jgi:hypothetical protein
MYKTRVDMNVNGLMTSNNQLQFGDPETYINQGSDGRLCLAADVMVKVECGILGIYPPADTDSYIFFSGTSNSGYLYWFEDEDYFKFMDDVVCGENLTVDDYIFNNNTKSGATQAAAGAAANEIWKTNGHASLPDNVLMIGV